MGVPKYKKYPESKGENLDSTGQNSVEDKGKVLKLQEEIKDLLKNEENIEKAARFFERLLREP